MTSTQTLSATTPGAIAVRSAGELCRAVQRADLRGRPIDLGSLDRVLAADAPRALLEVQAGTPWTLLAGRVPLASPALQAWAARTGGVGQSVAENRPGPDGQPLVALVEAISLVTPDGTLCPASRRRHADLFALAIGGQGLFGLIYSVTLRIDALARAATQCRLPERLDLPHAPDRAAETRALGLFVPPAALEAFLGEARGLADAWRVPIARIEVTPTRVETETALRWAKQPYAALTLQFGASSRLGAQVRELQLRGALIDCAIRRGGSFPIATTPEATRAQIAHCYPELAELLDEKRRRDPSDRLSNPWYRHHLRLLREAPLQVRWNAQAASA